MTSNRLAAILRKLTPTPFDDATLLMWLSDCENSILTDIMLAAPQDCKELETLSDAPLLVPEPWDKLYLPYMQAQVAHANGEYDHYANYTALYNAYRDEYARYILESVHPADGRSVITRYYLSAYAIAVEHGYKGTEAEWLASLKGQKGDTGEKGEKGEKGDKGDKGDPGAVQSVNHVQPTADGDVQINAKDILASIQALQYQGDVEGALEELAARPSCAETEAEAALLRDVARIALGLTDADTIAVPVVNSTDGIAGEIAVGFIRRSEAEDAAPGSGDVSLPTEGRVEEILEGSQLSMQIADLSVNKVSANSFELENAIIEEDIDFSLFDDMGLSSENGVPIAYEGFAASDFIDLSGVVGIYRYGTTTKFSLWPYYFYDENKDYIQGSRVPPTGEGTTDYEIVDYNGKQVTWLDLNPNAKYIRVLWHKSRPYTYVVVRGSGKVKSYDVPHLTIEKIEPLRLYGKTIVNFGDSVFGNFRDSDETTDKSISKMIAEATGAKVFNAGFGGCRMGRHSKPWDYFSMHALADSIASGSWEAQENALTGGYNGFPTYFRDTLTMLEGIKWDDVDIITIGYGTNDYSGDVFLHGSEATFENEWDYFKGALRYSIRTILQAYPHIRIAVISPCWRWFLAGGAYAYSSDDEQARNTRGYMLTDYVDACEVVCKEYHIPYIDTYYTLGFNEYTHLEYFPGVDGTHPNQKGRQLRADRITGQLLSIF